jgi:CheY-like chemotaxis protein
LTRQLLIFSRKQVVESKAVRLNEVFEPLLQMIKRILGENVELKTNLAEGLDLVKADPAQLEQVLMNLLVNARDAMPEGGTVTLEAANVVLDAAFTNTHLTVNPGPHVLLTVTDTGIGMSGETLERLFEPFFTTKPVGKGTGLGLLTVYGIIKQCKGTILVSSQPGVGTVFKLYFPALPRRTYTPEPGAEDELLSTKPKSKEKVETLLVVEDEDNLRTLICEVLTQQGYQVMKATNGREALELLHEKKAQVDLIVTDMIMPEMGGLELIRQAHLIRPEIRTLYMSGYTDVAFDAKLSTDPKSTALFIQKPFSSSLLIERVRQILDA